MIFIGFIGQQKENPDRLCRSGQEVFEVQRRIQIKPIPALRLESEEWLFPPP
jgi:hypothetical protein